LADPLTIAGAGLAVLGSKDVLTKILGPTADYIGAEAAGLVKKCNINLDNIFVKASRKIGDDLDNPGAVSPRVLKHILDEGRFCEDELAAEYYGGMLAGSREETGKDDQCLPYLSKVKQMSVYQIKLHFAFYYQVLKLHKGSDLNLGLGNDLPKAGLFLPHEFLFQILPPEKQEQYWDLMAHCVVGLNTHGLINTYSYGEAEHLKKRFPNAEQRGIYLEPNFVGAELFLWALGKQTPNGHKFFETNISDVDLVIDVPDLAQAKANK
jgi:hypothetical protein